MIPHSVVKVRHGGVLALGVLALITLLIAVGASRHLSDAEGEPAATKELQSDGLSTSPQAAPAQMSGISFVNARTGRKSPLPRSIRSLSSVGILQVSPDGSKLAFSGQQQIFVARVDGTHLRALADGDIESAPSWSPDGKSVVFNVAGQVCIADVATGKTTQVVDGHRWVYHPNFSRDGQQILFSRSPGGSLAMWTVSTSGGPAVLLRRRAAFGTYSPDGTSIAYRRTSFDGHSVMMMTESALRIVDVDGRNQRRLTEIGDSMNRVPENLLPQGDSLALWPMWSPDGTRIAYERLYGQGVYVHNVRTGRTWSLSDGTRPSWLDNTTLIVADQ